MRLEQHLWLRGLTGTSLGGASFAPVLWLLLIGHAIADYPLQGDFLSKGKNHNAPLPGVPWWICLLAHSLIHAGFVTVITSSMFLGAAEFVIHTAIDFGKCEGWFGFKVDQGLHVGCKVLWAALA